MKKISVYTFVILSVVLLSSCTAEELPQTQQSPLENAEIDTEFSLVEPKK